MSGRRALHTLHQRRAKASLRASRLSKVVRCCKQAAKLARPGAGAQARWGSQTQGISPIVMMATRRMLATTSGLRRPGECTATCMALAFGPRAEPEYAYRCDILT